MFVKFFCFYGERLLEDDVNKKKGVYWRIYHILAFLYSFILDVRGYFGLKFMMVTLLNTIKVYLSLIISSTIKYHAHIGLLGLRQLIIIIKQYSLILFSNGIGFNTKNKKIKIFELFGKESENI